MKKALLILGGVLLLTLGAVGMASANAGPHGNFGGGTSTPDGCAGCHRAHTGTGPYLLAASSPDALCQLCHSSTGTLDVFDGLLTSNNAQLNGGGFQYMGGTTQSTGAAVQSSHTVELLGGASNATAWGSGTNGTGAQGQLECVSCHNPHGSTNYRILNDSGSWVAAPTTSILKFTASEVITNASGPLAEPADDSRYAPGSWAALSNTYYTNGIDNFCATCHEQYLTTAGSYKTPSTDSASYTYPGTQDVGDSNGNAVRYRHVTSKSYTTDRNATPAKMIRAAVSVSGQTYRGSYTCLTCHFAHGTTATAGPMSTNASPAHDSANLLYDNRGMCQACHKKP